jgi:type II secretory pathway predicted ATPase ExeA
VSLQDLNKDSIVIIVIVIIEERSAAGAVVCRAVGAGIPLIPGYK